MSIPKQTVDTILEAARIEEVVGEFVSLKRNGTRFIGLCPFHNEKTPSFYVTPGRNIFKCFGCGKGGSAVSFLMEHEHFTYPEALRYLAKKYGIAVEEREQSPEELQLMNERESLYALSTFAQDYFSHMLTQDDIGRAIGMSYFKERGFSDETLNRFGLGYCLDQWDAFTKEALRKGYNPDHLVTTGLSIRRDDGSLYDRFRARVMFPIHNLSGRVVGFGGRVLSTEKTKIAKYVNSVDSIIYSKSKLLYGLYFAKNEILKKDTCFLVEGYTDVLSLHQIGVANVVSSSGTSLTTEQIKLIGRYTKNIHILYDGDPAGIKASFRGIDMILSEGMNVRIVLFPDGHDPDSYARSHSAEEVHEFIRLNARDFISFKTELLMKECDQDPIKKTELIREIVTSIAIIPDPIARAVYNEECSRTLNISEAILIRELNKLLRKQSQKIDNDHSVSIPEQPVPTPKQQPEEVTDPIEYIERELIRILLNYGEKSLQIGEQNLPISDYIMSELLNDEIQLEHPLYHQIFHRFLIAFETKIPVNVQRWVEDEQTSPDELNLLTELLSMPYQLSPNWIDKGVTIKTEQDSSKLVELVEMTVLALKLKHLDRQIKQTQQTLKLSPTEMHEELERDLLLMVQLKRELLALMNRI